MALESAKSRIKSLPKKRYLGELLLVCLVVTAVLIPVFKLWDLNPRIPVIYSGDGLTSGMLVQRSIEGPWVVEGERQGAPFIGSRADFPTGGENLQYLITKAFGVVTDDWALSMNAYLFLTYYLVAIAAYAVCRVLKIPIWLAVVVGVLYSFLPYHIWRQAGGHVARTGYFLIPFAVLFLLALFEYKKHFFRAHGEKLRLAKWPVIGTAAFALLFGAGDTQMTFYIGILAVVVAITVAIAHRDWRPLAVGFAFVFLSMGSLVVNNAPYLIERAERGPNPDVAQRSIGEQELYGLRIARMILPTTGIELSPLSGFTEDADNASGYNESSSQGFGWFGIFGFVVSLLAVAVRATSRRQSDSDTLPARLGILSLTAMVFAVPSGLAYLLTLGGLGMYRTWNRISIIIAFCCFLAAAWAVLWVWRRYALNRAMPVRAAAAGITAFVLLAAGLTSQISPRFLPDYEARANEFNADRNFYEIVEADAPTGGMIYQFPYHPYPEHGKVQELSEYQQFKGYLHTEDLNWSYSAIKGRPEGDWQLRFARLPLEDQVAAITAIGFDGTVVYRQGYADRGEALEMALLNAGAVNKSTHATGNTVYYDLRPVRERMEEQLSAQEIEALRIKYSQPLTVNYGRDWYGQEATEDRVLFRWMPEQAVLIVTNPRDQVVDTDLRFNAIKDGQPTSFTITWGDESRTFEVGPDGRDISIPISLEPGQNRVSIESLDSEPLDVDNDDRELYLRIGDVSFSDGYGEDLPDLSDANASEVINQG
jgi:phosphoglycerol transferase